MHRFQTQLGKLTRSEALLFVPALLLALGYEIFGVPLGKSGIPLPLPGLGSIPNLQLKLFPMEMFLAWAGVVTLTQFRRWPRGMFWTRLTILTAVLLGAGVLRAIPDLRQNPVLVVRNCAFCWYLALPLMVAAYPIPAARWETFFRVFYAGTFVYFLGALMIPFIEQDPTKLAWPLDIGLLLALGYALTTERFWTATITMLAMGFAFGVSYFGILQRTAIVGLALGAGLLLVGSLFRGSFPRPRWMRLMFLVVGVGLAFGLLSFAQRRGEQMAKSNSASAFEGAQKFGKGAEANAQGLEKFRWNLWVDAWDAFSTSPFLGIGFYRPVVYRVYGGQGRFFENDGSFEFRSQGIDNKTSPPIAGPHNSYLNALTRLGFLGAGFLFLHLACAALLISRGYYACFLILVGQILYAFFNVGFEGPVHSFPLLLLVGVGLKVAQENSARYLSDVPASGPPTRASRAPGPRRLGLVHVPYRLRGGEDMHVATLREAYRAVGFEPIAIPEQDSDEIVLGAGARALTFGEPAHWDELVRKQSLDFLHLHNIHPNLGPAFLRWIIDRKIPAIMTVHNHRFYCTNGLALDGPEICTACRSSPSFLRPLIRNCNGSVTKTAYHSAALSEIRRQALLRRAIRTFLAPSPYIVNELQAAGIPASQIRLFPHPVDVSDADRVPAAAETDVAFVGRLSAEKGVMQLLRAARQLPNRRFTIVGEGPLEYDARREAATLSNVRMLGQLKRPETLAVIKAARVICVPSLCHESFSLVAAEALSLGARLVVPFNKSFLYYAEAPFNAVNAIIANPNSLAYSLEAALDQPRRPREEVLAIQKRFDMASFEERLRKVLGEAIYGEST